MVIAYRLHPNFCVSLLTENELIAPGLRPRADSTMTGLSLELFITKSWSIGWPGYEGGRERTRVLEGNYSWPPASSTSSWYLADDWEGNLFYLPLGRVIADVQILIIPILATILFF